MHTHKLPPLTQSHYKTTLEVRISDINHGQHLGNDALVSLLGEARARFLKELGFSEMTTTGFGILVTQLVVNYLDQAYFTETLEANLALGQVYNSSVELFYELERVADRAPIARAMTLITFYDYEKKKISKVPAAFKEAFDNSLPA